MKNTKFTSHSLTDKYDNLVRGRRLNKLVTKLKEDLSKLDPTHVYYKFVIVGFGYFRTIPSPKKKPFVYFIEIQRLPKKCHLVNLFKRLSGFICKEGLLSYGAHRVDKNGQEIST